MVQPNPSGASGGWDVVSDRALVEALRERQTEAVDEFIRRFEPVANRYARWLRVPVTERVHWMAELLYDVAMTLGRGRGEPPRHLGAYVAGACRLRALEQRSADELHHRRILEAIRDVHENVYGLRETVVTSLCSEHSLRDARGPEWEPPSLSPVLDRLLRTLLHDLTPAERRIQQWLGDQISYTKIAEWLGISRSAAIGRIQRMRARWTKKMLHLGAELDDAGRDELIRFLRRTGAVDREQLLALERPDRGADGESEEER